MINWLSTIDNKSFNDYLANIYLNNNKIDIFNNEVISKYYSTYILEKNIEKDYLFENNSIICVNRNKEPKKDNSNIYNNLEEEIVDEILENKLSKIKQINFPIKKNHKVITNNHNQNFIENKNKNEKKEFFNNNNKNINSNWSDNQLFLEIIKRGKLTVPLFRL